MRSHQGITHERILRCTSGRYHGVDKHTGLEGKCCHEECLIYIAYVKRDDGTLGLTNLKALLTETLQGIVGNLRATFRAFRESGSAGLAGRRR